MPVDPVSRANNRQLRYRIVRDLYSLTEGLTSRDASTSAKARKEMRDHLTAIAPALSQKPYFMSDEYSLVDCCLAPLIWRLEFYGIRLPQAADGIIAYGERLFARAAFKSSLSEVEGEMRI